MELHSFSLELPSETTHAEAHNAGPFPLPLPATPRTAKRRAMSDKAASEPLRHIEPSIDQRQALKSAAARLNTEFADTLNPETIELFLYSSYDQLAATATVQDFLALLAERFARQRLRALARVEGKLTDGRPVVLFLCNHNAGRSQMAMGFFTRLAGNAAWAWSGGSKPKGEINPAVIAVMAERGIDLTNEYPKPWGYEILKAADVVITMGCDDAPPNLARPPVRRLGPRRPRRQRCGGRAAHPRRN